MLLASSCPIVILDDRIRHVALADQPCVLSVLKNLSIIWIINLGIPPLGDIYWTLIPSNRKTSVLLFYNNLDCSQLTKDHTVLFLEQHRVICINFIITTGHQKAQHGSSAYKLRSLNESRHWPFGLFSVASAVVTAAAAVLMMFASCRNTKVHSPCARPCFNMHHQRATTCILIFNNSHVFWQAIAFRLPTFCVLARQHTLIIKRCNLQCDKFSR